MVMHRTLNTSKAKSNHNTPNELHKSMIASERASTYLRQYSSYWRQVDI